MWDNTYSWLTDKTIQYTIVVSEPCSRTQRRERRVKEAVREMQVVDKKRAACRVEMNALQKTLAEQSETVEKFVQRLVPLHNTCSQHQKEGSQVLVIAQSTLQELSNHIQVLDDMQATCVSQIETLGTLETTFRSEAQELHLMNQLGYKMDNESG